MEDRLSETERKVELHAADIAVIDYDLFAEFALGLGAFALQQVTTTCLRTNNLTGSGNFEPLGHGLLGFAAGDGFWHGAWTITERIPLGNWKIQENGSRGQKSEFRQRRQSSYNHWSLLSDL